MDEEGILAAPQRPTYESLARYLMHVALGAPFTLEEFQPVLNRIGASPRWPNAYLYYDEHKDLSTCGFHPGRGRTPESFAPCP